jgi:protein TonB
MLLQKPDRMTDSQEEGNVVVEIIVDETGKVIKATPGQRNSTTTSSNLYAKARQAALTVKFNPSPEGIKEQRGTYTFVFLLE